MILETAFLIVLLPLWSKQKDSGMIDWGQVSIPADYSNINIAWWGKAWSFSSLAKLVRNGCILMNSR